MKNVQANCGDPVKFQTQVYGNPVPVVSWYKDDKPLLASNRNKEFHEENVHTLLLLEVEPDDSGTYEAVVENAHGKVYSRASLTVIGDVHKEKVVESEPEDKTKPKLYSTLFSQPFVEVPLEDQFAKEGSSLCFKCKIVHSESMQSDYNVSDIYFWLKIYNFFLKDAEIQWLKNDQVIKKSKFFNMNSENDIHELMVLEAFPEDEGEYKCLVTNPAGSACTTGFLKVQREFFFFFGGGGGYGHFYHFDLYI